jgi:hypothetical protein
VNGDVVDEEALVVDGEHEQSHDGAVALGDGHVTAADDLFVVVGHGARREPDPLEASKPLRRVGCYVPGACRPYIIGGHDGRSSGRRGSRRGGGVHAPPAGRVRPRGGAASCGGGRSRGRSDRGGASGYGGLRRVDGWQVASRRYARRIRLPALLSGLEVFAGLRFKEARGSMDEGISDCDATVLVTPVIDEGRRDLAGLSLDHFSKRRTSERQRPSEARWS